MEARDGREVALEIVRDKKRRTLRVRMVLESEFFNESLIRKKIGASLQDLTPELARVFGLGGLQGLLVGGVDLNGPADKAKLDRGMVITGLDGHAVAEVTEAARILFGKAKGDKVVVELVYSRRRGPFYSIERTAVELQTR
jgi:S1-C subfamily serine protease